MGTDADPYQLAHDLHGIVEQVRRRCRCSRSATCSPNPNLKPELTRRRGRRGARLLRRPRRRSTRRTTTSHDEPDLNLTISPTSGFTRGVDQRRRDREQGLRGAARRTPVRIANGSSGTSTFNYAQNRSKVVELAAGLQTIVLGSAVERDRRGARRRAVRRDPRHAVSLRDEATGQLLIDRRPPAAGDDAAASSATSSPTGPAAGATRSRYKRFVAQRAARRAAGRRALLLHEHVRRLLRRAQEHAQGREVDWDNPGVIVKGIDATTGQPNTTTVTSEEYFQSSVPAARAVHRTTRAT